MDDLNYFLKQLWLAHREMGLGALVEAEMWVSAGLVAMWFSVRLVKRLRSTGAICLPSGDPAIEQRSMS